MEALIYFAMWAGLFYLMMRFGCGAHVMGHGQKGENTNHGSGNSSSLRWVPPVKDTDPVCGKKVATDRGKSSVHDGHVYYFCSRECREVFEAAPAQYLNGGEMQLTTEREKSHV